jgi:hypothetical protein
MFLWQRPADLDDLYLTPQHRRVEFIVIWVGSPLTAILLSLLPRSTDTANALLNTNLGTRLDTGSRVSQE